MDVKTLEKHERKLKEKLGVTIPVYYHEHSFLKDKGRFMYENGCWEVNCRKRIGTLAHELRHVWQYKHRKAKGFKFPSKTNSAFIDFIIYLCGRKERDANMFAAKYCLHNGFVAEGRRYYVKTYISFFVGLLLVVPCLILSTPELLIKKLFGIGKYD